jgi:DNA-binding CsgD family transcriptional regulator
MQPIRPDAVPPPPTKPSDRTRSRAQSREDAVVIPLRSRRRAGRSLTARERRALELTANGLEVGEIAKVLSAEEATFVSGETVKSYQQAGRAKLEARSIVHAVAIALRSRLIQLDGRS